MPSRSNSGDSEGGQLSPSNSIHRSNSETANSQFPLNDIDYESNPNAVAQETGLQCACAFVEFGGRPAATAAKAVFTAALVEKNILGSARAGSKKAAVELCLVLVECEGNADTVWLNLTSDRYCCMRCPSEMLAVVIISSLHQPQNR